MSGNANLLELSRITDACAAIDAVASASEGIIVRATLSLLVIVTSLLALPTASMSLSQAPVDATAQRTLVAFNRRYRDGEKVAYHMEATNKGRYQTTTYQADVNCVVKKGVAGVFVEECAWSNLIVNNSPVTLPPPAQNFRQTLSLDPASTPSVPDLSQVIPLVGPITDLLTFYSDLWLANKLNQLHHVGDHFYFLHGTPNSWADGNYVLLGQDSIDFDFTLAGQTGRGIVLVDVRHVPPAKPQIKLSAEWLKVRVTDTANNWIEVEKSGDGRFSAEVGKETFDVHLKVATDGKLLSATMDNPIEVLARDCTDPELTHCSDPTRYQIKRQIKLTLLP